MRKFSSGWRWSRRFGVLNRLRQRIQTFCNCRLNLCCRLMESRRLGRPRLRVRWRVNWGGGFNDLFDNGRRRLDF
jgi:hypothetical protein